MNTTFAITNMQTVIRYTFVKYISLSFILLLHVVKFLVIAVGGEQLVVSTPFHDASFMEHADLIGIADGGETVGDGHGGAGLHQPFKSILHQTLALGVECRGGLVEDEDGWVLQDGTGDGDALAMMNSWALAIFAASSTCSRVALGTPKAMLL